MTSCDDATSWTLLLTILCRLITGSMHVFSLALDVQVAPSIAAVRFVYELLVQEWGINGLRRYRANDTESQASDPPWA